ncbi:MAG: MMPL family transporter [Sutterellaceae bacterium]|nr:MMPL family transporter [Sutterellaceae bacterium]
MKPSIRFAQVLWVGVIVVLIGLCAWRFDGTLIQTDVRALLPQEERTQTASDVLTRIADTAAQNLFVLVRAAEDGQTETLAQSVQTALKTGGLDVQKNDAGELARSVASLMPYRENFISQDSLVWLEQATDNAIANRALKNLYRPISADVVSWENDPLGLFSERFRETFLDGRFSLRGDFVTVADREDANRPWVLLTVRVKSALQLGGLSVTDVLTQARVQASEKFVGSEILASGLALISEAATGQASRESSMIGCVSAAALALFIIVFLRSFSAVGIVLGTLAMSFAVAFSVVWLTFGGIHLITVVFGMTLLGVAADYVFHYLTELFESTSCFEARNALAKGLTVSLVSSVAGYAVMLFIPMPSLQQMALFCMSGLTSAWLCVLLILPSVSRVRSMPPLTRRWTIWLKGLLIVKTTCCKAIVLGVVALVATTGMMRLTTTDELRLLTKLPENLQIEQQHVAQILAPESPAQFFVVRASTSDAVIGSVQALIAELKKAQSDGTIAGFRTGLGMLTSSAEQLKTYRLVHAANARARELVEQKLSTQVKAALPTQEKVLNIGTWLKMPMAQPMQSFWIDQNQALVMLSGVTPASLAKLEAIGKALTHVEFVNTTGEISASLAVWRDLVAKILFVAFAAMAVILFAIYKKQSLRMLVPSAFGILVTLGIVGWLNIPFSLFTVLPLILLLALGVDYSVLLYSRTSNTTVHLSVFLAAISTILSFGLLSFSATPALHYFGITLWVGIAAVWGITMVMRPQKRVE